MAWHGPDDGSPDDEMARARAARTGMTARPPPGPRRESAIIWLQLVALLLVLGMVGWATFRLGLGAHGRSAPAPFVRPHP